ncbi:MAG: ArsR/SmtB family transcription factor [Boseongicola sp.]
MLSDRVAALGDPTRLAIVESLLDDGEQSAGEICARVTVSAPAVSRHLKVLCDAGLLRRRVDRQRRFYSANPTGLGAINDWFELHVQFWTESVDRLQVAVEQGEK